MASKKLFKIKGFSRLRKIFRSWSRNDPASTNKDALMPKDPSLKPEHSAQTASTAEPISQASAAPYLADILPSAAIAPDPAPASSQTSTPSEAVKVSLWDRAYDSLREKEGQQVEEYEELLSRELQATTGSKNDITVTNHDDAAECHIKPENKIEGTNHKIRLAQLETITSSGLRKLDEKKARYLIFGHEFIPRDQLAKATQFIQNIKAVIDEAVRVSPEASLAWAGVSVILPIFMNPSVAEEVSRDGCLYVTSRILFYVKLESLLFSSNRIQDSGLNAELEGSLIELYRQIIDFQIRTVRRVYLTRLARYREDTLRHEDWKGMMARIQKSEETFRGDFKLVNDAAKGRELEKLSSNAEKFFADINSVLVPSLKDSRRASTFAFQNDGPGSQFNVTGGRQNNMVGSGIQFYGGSLMRQ
ncbi:hypothetical protein TrVFT333_010490 [Trichoderma virens FT-333]|nr:hypothetical protein TrVFT333_010490 [Trichoderma virens FT-333]